MTNDQKTYLIMGISMLMLLSGVHFLITLVGVLTWISLIIVTLAMIVMFVMLYNLPLDTDTYKIYRKFLMDIDKPVWRVVLGWTLVFVFGWLLYDSGWEVTAIIYITLIGGSTLVVFPTLKNKAIQAVKEYEDKHKTLDKTMS